MNILAVSIVVITCIICFIQLEVKTRGKVFEISFFLLHIVLAYLISIHFKMQMDINVNKLKEQYDDIQMDNERIKDTAYFMMTYAAMIFLVFTFSLSKSFVRLIDSFKKERKEKV